MNSNGISYFPVDVDIYDDPKVVPALCQYGEDAERVLFRLLSILYREGYFIPYTDALRFSLSMKTRKEPDYIHGVIKTLADWGFFDKELFENFNVLTSTGIQKRWVQATRKRSKKGFDYKYWLIEKDVVPEPEQSPAEELRKVAEKIEKEAAVLANGAEDSQKRAEGKKKPKSLDEKKQDIKRMQKEFYDTLVPYAKSYTKETLRKFYDYWSEPNKSLTKIRWQLEKTWDLNRRLVRWSNNEFIPKQKEPESIVSKMKEL